MLLIWIKITFFSMMHTALLVHAALYAARRDLWCTQHSLVYAALYSARNTLWCTQHFRRMQHSMLHATLYDAHNSLVHAALYAASSTLWHSMLHVGLSGTLCCMQHSILCCIYSLHIWYTNTLHIYSLHYSHWLASKVYNKPSCYT